jgi:hypothetical protein
MVVDGAETEQVLFVVVALDAPAHQLFLATSGHGGGKADDSQVIRKRFAMNGAPRSSSAGTRGRREALCNGTVLPGAASSRSARLCHWSAY